MLPKNQFLEKSDPCTENFKNFARTGFTASGAILPNILYDHYFPTHIPLPSFVRIRPVLEEIISENVLQTHCNIGVKHPHHQFILRQKNEHTNILHK